MRNLYAEYLKERENVIHHRKGDLGFADYSINGEECYISNIYVVPEAREQRIAAQMADEIEAIAKEAGCKFLTGTVFKNSNGITVSVKAMLKVGFEVADWNDQKILFIRRIK